VGQVWGLERRSRSVRGLGIMSHMGTGLWIGDNTLRRRCASSCRVCGAKAEVDELGSSSSWVGNSIVDVGRVVESAAGRVPGVEGSRMAPSSAIRCSSSFRMHVGWAGGVVAVACWMGQNVGARAGEWSCMRTWQRWAPATGPCLCFQRGHC
jgi:hypothetical protein